MGEFELLLILVVGLLVIGPERLPETVRTLGLWMGRLRRSFNAIKTEIDKEVGMDEIRRQLHNEAVMEEMKRIEAEVQNSIQGPDTQHPASSNASQPQQSVADDGDKPTNETPADEAETPAVAEPANAQVEPTTTDQADIADEPAPPLPRSEAELEALHASRVKAARDV